MRVFTLLCTTVVVACLNPTISYGQGTEQHRSDEPSQSEPYHKHHDTRHGHDHFYPDRGAIVRDLPRGTIGTSYAGVSYRYHDGIWLEPRGPAFMVIAPPVGLVAPTLPLYSTVVTHGGETFLYVNDTYYRPRPDLSGYEVVNDPFEESAPAAPEALVGGQLPGAPATPPPPPPPTALTGGAISASIPAAAISTGVPAAAATLGAASAPATAQAETARISAQAASFPPPAATSMTVASAPASNLASAVTPSAAATLSATPYRPSAGATAVPIPVPAGSTATGSVTAPLALAPETPKGPKVFLYPKNGQTSDQQARDRYDCYRFAVTQSGFDPMRSTGATGELQSDYERAQSACFEARGYSSR